LRFVYHPEGVVHVEVLLVARLSTQSRAERTLLLLSFFQFPFNRCNPLQYLLVSIRSQNIIMRNDNDAALVATFFLADVIPVRAIQAFFCNDDPMRIDNTQYIYQDLLGL
jgi:hypothetical protein